ncbi:ABC transporter ATP-binding protein [Gorillibacterium timonense]|uniref:ABC transporter ATP-binding protein n=1 Tax=Gorillibacterium timonense TaxID=1689269 RepID=UPI000A7E7007|nr:ABC transporter ATP-binding protein [Gorillibacterium timonense]
MRKTERLKEQPNYTLWQNSAHMIGQAWRVRKSVLYLCLILALLAVATNLAELIMAPVILQKVEAVVPLPELVITIVLFAALLLVLASLKAYVLTNTLFGRIEVRLSILNKIHHKVSTTSFPNTEDAAVLKKLEKSNIAVSDNHQATEAIWNTLSDLLKNTVGFVIYLILLSSLDIVLVAVILITTVAGYFVNKRINEWGFRHREEESEYSKKMTYVCKKAEEPHLAKDIRIFGMRPWLEDVYSSTLRTYEAFITRRERIYIWANVMDIVLSLLRNGIAYFFLITMTINTGLPASKFLLYFTAVGGFTTWITGILSSFSTLHTQSLDISTVREFLETPEPFLFDEGKPLTRGTNDTYEIELRNVSFRHPGAEQDTLHKLNLIIPAGEKLAIVGLNGAGKTTLVKLICGFYDPTEGEVLLNGVNIREYNRFDYYQLFSAVFQQFSLLEVTLAENVAQSDEWIDWPRVKECIEKAGLTAKVESMRDRYQTRIGRQVYEDGIELSGGETQRLMLARALYKAAPIVVLDEPTAALDPIAENDIYLKYNEMTAGCTSVYISHRLASTRFCDRIIFIADGSIAEEGTHESLMEQGSKYADLFHIQSKYYKEGSDFGDE